MPDTYDAINVNLALAYLSPDPNQPLVKHGAVDWPNLHIGLRKQWSELTVVQKATLIKAIVDSGWFTRKQLADELGFDKNVTWWLYDIGQLPKETLQDLDSGKITRKEALKLAQEQRKASKQSAQTTTCTRAEGHGGPCNGLPAQTCVSQILEKAEDLDCPQETQVLPNFIADRVVSPQVPFMSKSEAERKRDEFFAGFQPPALQIPIAPACFGQNYVPPQQLRRFKQGRPSSEYDSSLPNFDEAYESYRTFLGINDPPRRALKVPGERKRIVVVNDLHDPFKDEEAFQEFIRRERGKADLCILAGDGCDMWSWSRWPKSEYRCSPKEEMQAHKKSLNMLAESFGETIVLPGNHLDRARKYMQGRGLPPEMLDYLEFCAPAALSPYAFLLADIPNVKLAPPLTCGDAKYNFLCQIGDLVIGHPEVFSIIPNRAVSNFIHWLQSFAKPMGLVGDFKVAGIGHTHQAGKTFADYGVVGFEMGCMQTLPDYSADPKLRGAKRPPVIGYTVFVQEDGVTNVEESNFIPLRFGRSFIN